MTKLYSGTLCSIILLISSIAYCQTDFRKGYIVTLTNDTITGLVDYRNNLRNSQICTFKPGESAEAVAYKPEDIKGYQYLDGRLYESKLIRVDSVTESLVFLEIVVKGRVNLYFYKSPAKESYFMSKDTIAPMELMQRTQIIQKNGETYMAETKPYLGILSFFMNDHAGSAKKIQNISLDYKSLYNLVTAYNAQFKVENTLVVAGRQAVKFNTGPIAGLSYHGLKFYRVDELDPYLSSPVYQSTAGIIGWLVNVTVPAISRKISLQAEIYYTQNKYHIHYEKHGSLGYNTIIKYDVSLLKNYVKMPFLIRYTYPRGIVKPFVQGGISTAYAVRSYNHVVKSTTFGTYVTTWEGEATKSKNTQQSLVLAVGMQSRILSRLAHIEARMEKGNGINPIPNGSYTTFSINSSYSLLFSMAL